MAFKVYVDGQEGTTGLRLFEYLEGRADIELLRIDSALRKDPDERARLLNAADVAFLCLPDAASREAAAMVDNPDTCLIDASTAFRVADDWVYGLPELEAGQRERIRASKRIANVGCHASAFILAVRPLVDAGLLPADYPVSATSLTGYSGGGKSMIADYQADTEGRLQAPRAYALGLEHKHLPEMQRYTGLTRAPIFVPTVGPFLKGLAVTVPLQMSHLKPGTDVGALYEALRQRYAGEPFIRVHAPDDPAGLDGGFFDVQGSNDTNRVDLFLFGNGERQCVIARLDNLGKGAAGAAVQNMNVHLGIDETTGLTAG
ncbi:N-acetyl-gamma-glutamyl-phosphate reductase [Alloalcanivorax dieselolei B5]|uniref:N-acetyl-gamma-glutamyl-phosphate reductase n=1 Tax=Alcanivorax dieselolei (strain DSM 16502 / CGMCC 1.3690 / MCCC 1A00001 / B-5) TaxID=930169 RepID=K0CCT7_ALCDB|nr:N-acetyl-gamma-glutamyl-phosphate reductase [Alloalcanivorax dieselolei]AFT71394.1 N-acetyl-gamma-glutamyl-phosphate reductase [Alloalcanivorax dieselolei B5]GGK08272.1 N-acetyl-gamma-glutamyl-phosphate reductase [Alloalcanivorax dieselolei]